MADQQVSTPPRSDRVTRALLAATLVALLIVAGVGWRLVAPELSTALSATSPQHVHNELPGVPVPAATLDQELFVSAEKCNLLDTPVTVRGVKTWQTRDPFGNVITSGEGQVIREPGCEQFDFVNVIPSDVISTTREILAATGRDYVVWTIAGEERVTGSCCYLPVTWETEPFRLYEEAP